MDEQTSDEVAMIGASPLFDGDWYARRFPDVGISGMTPQHHYRHYGYLMGRDPSPGFDSRRYLSENEDVAKLRLNPLLHFLKHGSREGRYAYRGPSCVAGFPETVDGLLESFYVFEPAKLGEPLRESFLAAARGAKVSVVMPTWNRAHVIERALSSAFGQTLQPFEVIVVDDGSSDGTPQKLREIYRDEIESGRLVLVGAARGGVSHARNQGLARATGEIIAYLDSDNAWHPDHLLYTVGALARNLDAKCAYTAIRINSAESEGRRVVGRRFDRTRLLRGNYIDLNAFVHRRGLYERMGGFDRALRRLVDWDLIIRYTEDQVPLHVPVVTVEYYLDRNALGNITYTESLDEARDAIYVKHGLQYQACGVLTEAQIEKARRRLTFKPERRCSPDALHVVLSDLSHARELPELDGLDVTVIVWIRNEQGMFQAHASSASGGLLGTELEQLPEGIYWCPDLAQPIPAIDQLRALYLAVASGNIDLAVLSYSLAVGGNLRAACLRNQVVMTEKLVAGHLEPDRELRLGNHLGKILRMLPSPETSLYDVSIKALLGPDVIVDGKDLLLYERDGNSIQQIRSRPQLPRPIHGKRKPVILVLPMKVAVGGVERNTVEIMRALRERYDFVYVTMEKIFEEQGSLAGQVMEVAHRFVDLAEISTHANYLPLLRMLKGSYAPDVVWICNGSMWLCQHAPRLREIFDDVPIVDQQVYDVKEGWIRRYTEPGLQSFDRFIAINARIRDRFLGEFGMDADRVDLIYSALDSERFRERKRKLALSPGSRAKYGLPEGCPVFAFMGRLVDQKRPLDFLEIAARRAATNEHFVLVGNGALAGKVEEWLAANPGASVQWIPYVENTVEFWSLVSGMLVTSAYEGLPIAMLEALAMGVPVLSTDVGDIASVLADHQGGMIVDRIGDPDAFALQMNGFVDALDGMRSALVEESERVLDRFSARTIAAQYEHCWQAAIRQRAHRPEVGA